MVATSLLVIDDHPVFRAGVVALLSRLEGPPVVQEAGTLAEAWTALHATPFDCATLDLQLGDGNGFNLLRRARLHGLSTRFVVFSLFDDELLRSQAQALGASAFVTKSEDPEATLQVVRDVLSRPAPVRSEETVERPPLADPRPPLLEALSRLSPAERLVLQHVAMNRTSTQIAAELGLSPRTVQNHRAHICEKLGLRGNNKLLEVALTLRDVLVPPRTD